MMSFAASTLALLGVLLLAYLVIKGGAKMSSLKHRNASIQVLESTPVGSRERLLVVSYNNQRLLLGVTGQSINVLQNERHIEQDDGQIKTIEMNNKQLNINPT